MLGGERRMNRVAYSFKLLREFAGLARERKAYWIIPLIVILGVSAFLIVVGQSSAPLIYTLF